MAITNNKRSLCNKLVSDFDKLIQPGRSAKGAINSATDAMKSQLSGMIFSDTNDLSAALEAYRNQVKDLLPGDSISDLEEMKNFIDSCDYLKAFAPISAIIGTIGGIFDTISDLINGLSSQFPEFGAGGLGSLVDKLLNGLNFPGGDKIADLLALADKLLNCLSAGCAAFDPTYIVPLSQKSAELQSVYDDLGLVDDPLDPNYGKFDYSAMYNELGLSTSEIGAIDSVKGGINLSKDDGVGAVDAAKSAVKNAVKGGLF